MGFWQMVAKGFLDDKEYKRATAAQDAYNAQVQQRPTGPSRRAIRQADNDANAWLGMLDYSQTVMDSRDQDMRDRRSFVRDVIGGCWCGDPNCPNR